MSSNPEIHPAEFHVLLSLADGPKHGHGIKLEVRARTERRVNLGPGTLYGAIKRLAVRQLVAEASRDNRKVTYRITPSGHQVLRDELARMRQLLMIAEAKQVNVS